MSSVTPVQLGRLTFGGGSPFVLIAGPCVIESETHAWNWPDASSISRDGLGPFVFKASYDKANRTSGRSFRGPGLDEGLRVLAAIKARLGVPILTDIHEPSHAAPAAASQARTSRGPPHLDHARLVGQPGQVAELFAVAADRHRGCGRRPAARPGGP